MKRPAAAVLVAALTLTSLVSPAAPAVAAQEEIVRVNGGGWGHGVGMSQYGAQGQALEGRTAAEILAYYYQGTGLSPLASVTLPTDVLQTVPDALWVNLLRDRSSVTFEAIGGELELCQAGDGEGPCPRADKPQPGEIWTFQRVGGGCRFFRNGSATGAQVGQCRASVSWQEGTRIRVEGTEYASGTLKIRTQNVANGNFHVSLAIDLEDYVRGIAEVPSTWEQAALEAQAIAARTYAVYRFLQREQPDLRTSVDGGFTAFRQSRCWCHVYSSTFDQVYAGWTKEGNPAAAPWLQAVESTADQIITYFGPSYQDFTQSGVAGAFYSSSTAGWTESNTDGFGSSIQYPYLVSVDDPWSADPALNPNARWTRDVALTTILTALGWDTVDTIAVVSSAPGTLIEFSGTLAGQPVTSTKSGSWLRSKLGLPSGQILSLETGLLGTPSTGSPVEEQVVPFTDIETNEHATAIAAIWEVGIAAGCQADLYCPSEPVARWQMALFLTRLWPRVGFDLPAGADQGFTDIDDLLPEEHLAVNQLAELGITAGTSATTFSPYSEVSRWQMALFLVRLVEATGYPMPDGADQGFTDIAGLSSEAQVAINQLKQLGITTGTSATTFSPGDLVLRDQMASFIWRTLELTTTG